MLGSPIRFPCTVLCLSLQIENIKQGVGLKVQESHQLMQLLLEQLQPQQRGQDKEDIQPEVHFACTTLRAAVVQLLGCQIRPGFQHNALLGDLDLAAVSQPNLYQ